MINGALFRDAVISAAITINNRKREVDELNVYPVPDGDTGTNMSMTIGNSINELKRMSDNSTIAEVSAAAASAFLRGARGNSGVILSLIFRGISKGLTDVEEAGCDDFAKALSLGVEAAYKAVMKPVEGTILTVARLSAEKAKETALSTNDTTVFWHDVCAEAETTLAKTTDMLPQLKKAGVVDSGGAGLVYIAEGMKTALGGNISYDGGNNAPSAKHLDFSAFDENSVLEFGYCTEFLLRLQRAPELAGA